MVKPGVEKVKRGIILINLGSPDSTEVKDVKNYLSEFLMDERVIDYGIVARTLLVKGLIVPFRAAKSAEAYKTIWTDEGSPLINITRQLQNEVQKNFDVPVEIAMRYGNPSPKKAYENLLQKVSELEEVIIFPLYPHYAMSSYETAVAYMYEVYKKQGYKFNIKVVKPYYNDVLYINALAESMQPYLQSGFDKILFSYHGIPSRHILKSDTTKTHCLKVNDCCNLQSQAHNTCYRHQVFETTKLVAQKLNIPANKFEISFQSRLGKGWLEPFTDKRLSELPAEGIKNLLIVCPAFVSDCLETLEEIAERGKETFRQAGGDTYKMIPCMNSNERWVDAITQMILKTFD